MPLPPELDPYGLSYRRPQQQGYGAQWSPFPQQPPPSFSSGFSQAAPFAGQSNSRGEGGAGGGGGFNLSGAIPVVGGLLQGLGGALGQQDEMRQRQRELEEQRRQFNVGSERSFELGSRGQAQSEAAQANALQRQMALSGLSDQARHALSARAGMAPGQFRPNDLFNAQPGQVPSQGGIDLDQLQRQVGNYTPGPLADTSLQQALLRQLGYTPQEGGGWNTPAPAQGQAQQALSQIGMAAPQFIFQLAQQGNLDALRSIAQTGQGPSTQPGAGMHRYSAQEVELARQLLARLSQGQGAPAQMPQLPGMSQADIFRRAYNR